MWSRFSVSLRRVTSVVILNRRVRPGSSPSLRALTLKSASLSGGYAGAYRGGTQVRIVSAYLEVRAYRGAYPARSSRPEENRHFQGSDPLRDPGAYPWYAPRVRTFFLWRARVPKKARPRQARVEPPPLNFKASLPAGAVAQHSLDHASSHFAFGWPSSPNQPKAGWRAGNAKSPMTSA